MQLYIFILTKSFYISIDFPSLNTFSSSFFHIFPPKIYDILGLSNFRNKITQYNFFILAFSLVKTFSIILSFFSYSLGENNLLPSSTKPINLIQKHPHTIESYACIL